MPLDIDCVTVILTADVADDIGHSIALSEDTSESTGDEETDTDEAEVASKWT